MLRSTSSAQTHRRAIRPTRRPRDGRLSNLALVLQQLYQEQHLSRADLARRTGLPRVTISDLVPEHSREGLVRETGTAPDSRPGKPATLLEIDAAGRDIVAVDLSAPDTITGAVYSLRADRVSAADIALDGATGQDAIDKLMELIGRLLEGCEHQVLGIGVGSPGTIDSRGTVLSAPNLNWQAVPLASLITDRFGIPASVENDANAAVLAERSFAGGPDNLVRVQISRGVGAGLLIGGQIVLGDSAAAGEFGHVVVDENGEQCRCGKRGCLETRIRAAAINTRVKADPGRRAEILNEAGSWLGAALAPVVGMLDVTDVVLGGDMDLIDDDFLAGAQQVATARTHSEFRRDVELRRSTLGGEAVLLGAVALALRERLGVA
jgi:predicted NBD/HSP70 family sugar kinase